MVRTTGVVLLAAWGLFVAPSVRAEDWDTYYEKSGCLATPRYAETVEYCRRVAEASPWVHYTNFGTSPQGRPLPLVIVDREGRFTPESVRASGNAVVLVQAGIHAGEIEGKDAGLMLLRDIAVTRERADLLDGVTLLFIPIFNVDGHERFGPYNRINQNGPVEMGWRTTARNLNLNRDYLKADAPEMRDWIRLFVRWLPDFFVDCHTTDGADYQYVVTYGMEIFGNMDAGLTAWTRDVYLPDLSSRMEAAGFPMCPYAAFRDWQDPKSGLVSWVAAPKLSEGYTAIQNRVGLLVETHMLKDYRARVEGTYEVLRHTLALVGRERKTLVRLDEEADRRTASSAFRSEPFAVRYEMAPDSVMVEFLGVEYETVTSDLTGGTWPRFSGVPATFRIPYFNVQRPSVSVAVPEAYVVPPEWTEVIARLEMHGVTVRRLREATEIPVRTYRFHDLSWGEEPYEGRHPVRFKAEETEETRSFPAGTAVVPLAQRAARVAIHVLEPAAPDSYLGWGFFDPIFEQKEYAEAYVMESRAQEMIKADPQLREEFQKKVEEDTTFARNPWEMLNWFYARTPWWDDRKDAYPVGRLFRADVLGSLPLE